MPRDRLNEDVAISLAVVAAYGAFCVVRWLVRWIGGWF